VSNDKRVTIPHVCLLLDGSSSMSCEYADVIAATNTFINEQKKIVAPCDISLSVFYGSALHNVWEEVPIMEVPELTTNDYIPIGGTNARQCMHVLMDKYKHRKTLFCLLTDGEDGAAHFSEDETKEAVDNAVSRGWSFTYIGFGTRRGSNKQFKIPDSHSIFVPKDIAGLDLSIRAFGISAVMFRSAKIDFTKAMQIAQDSILDEIKRFGHRRLPKIDKQTRYTEAAYQKICKITQTGQTFNREKFDAMLRREQEKEEKELKKQRK
jgi:hypothetical protein